MKTIITIITILFFGQLKAESEPDSFDKKDLIEKLDRSELESDNDKPIELDSSILQFEIPKIELEQTKVRKPKKVTKKPKVSHKKVDKNKTTNPADKQKPANTNIKLILAKRFLQMSQIKKNDKIVIKNGKTHVYRLFKNKVVQYKFKSKIPTSSKGLKSNDKNSYYVINKAILIRDIKLLRPESNKKKTTNKKLTKKTSKKKPPAIAIVGNNVSAISDEVAIKRKAVEKKYNRDKAIKKSIKLKNLRANDVIYVVGDIQFVIRASKSSSAKNKYWLTEMIDVENSSLEKTGKNKYKVLRFYKKNK